MLLPNLAAYDAILKEGLEDESRKPEAEMVIRALLESLSSLAGEVVGVSGDYSAANTSSKVKEKIGPILGERVVDANNPRLTKAVLEAELGF